MRVRDGFHFWRKEKPRSLYLGGSLRARVSGVVKFYNPHSSFGYIVQDDGSDDVYVHAKALGAVPGGVLGAGDKVEYRVAVFNERPRAKDVRVLKRA